MQKMLQSSALRNIPWQKIGYLVAGGFLIAWLLNTPEGILGKADAIGYAVCHRIDARSFHLGERQFSLCARCTGQYLGAVLGLVYQLAVGRRRAGRPPWGVLAVLGVLVLIWAVDGFNSFLHLRPELFARYYLYNPNNTFRLLTGTGLGLGLSVMLLPAFHQTVWRRWNSKPALSGFASLGGMLALGLILAFLVLTENPLILYPLALVSSAGVLVILTLVYTMVWVMLFKLENRFDSLKELAFPLAAGFTTALTQIALLDFVRYLLTGTWDGFHFG